MWLPLRTRSHGPGTMDTRWEERSRPTQAQLCQREAEESTPRFPSKLGGPILHPQESWTAQARLLLLRLLLLLLLLLEPKHCAFEDEQVTLPFVVESRPSVVARTRRHCPSHSRIRPRRRQDP